MQSLWNVGLRSPKDAEPGYCGAGGCASCPGYPEEPGVSIIPAGSRDRARAAPRCWCPFWIGAFPGGLGISFLPWTRNKEVGEEGALSRRHQEAVGAPVSEAREAPPLRSFRAGQSRDSPRRRGGEAEEKDGDLRVRLIPQSGDPPPASLSEKQLVPAADSGWKTLPGKRG